MIKLLQHRQRELEIQDQPDLQDSLLTDALHGLERINFWSQSYRTFWPPIERLSRRLRGDPLTVLDIATGAGDIPRSLWRQAQRAGLSVRFAGCDVNPRTVEFAKQQAATRKADVDFFTWDVTAADLPRRYDVILCSLFLHHLDEPQALALLRRVADAANHLVLISDLVRGAAGLTLAHLGTRLLGTSMVNRVDGPRSVRAAFTIAEAKDLLQRAGLGDAILQRRWPCRFQATWEKRAKGKLQS